MPESILEINLGYGNVAEVQLQAENVDTRVVGPLPAAMIDKISRVILHLASGIKIDSDDGDIGLGAGKSFDPTIDSTNAKLAIALGQATSLQALAGNYPEPHLAIYFTGTNNPVRSHFPPVLITQAD